MAGFSQKPEFRFYLAIAFLLWSLLPHYELIVHSHGENGAGHHHATLSKAQIQFADQAAMALAASGNQVEAALFSGEEVPASKPFPGFPSLTKGRNISTHAHFQEDLNVAGLTDVPLRTLVPLHPVLIPPNHYFAPDLTVRVSLPARGPPALLPA